uniref:(northern house mosquito) hypothetical protein n=1 Tax=Culex pipiens TaxID=7175 RepID=A0A8D8B1U1_CULPI
MPPHVSIRSQMRLSNSSSTSNTKIRSRSSSVRQQRQHSGTTVAISAAPLVSLMCVKFSRGFLFILVATGYNEGQLFAETSKTADWTKVTRSIRYSLGGLI